MIRVQICQLSVESSFTIIATIVKLIQINSPMSYHVCDKCKGNCAIAASEFHKTRNDCMVAGDRSQSHHLRLCSCIPPNERLLSGTNQIASFSSAV